MEDRSIFNITLLDIIEAVKDGLGVPETTVYDERILRHLLDALISLSSTKTMVKKTKRVKGSEGRFQVPCDKRLIKMINMVGPDGKPGRIIYNYPTSGPTPSNENTFKGVAEYGVSEGFGQFVGDYFALNSSVSSISELYFTYEGYGLDENSLLRVDITQQRALVSYVFWKMAITPSTAHLLKNVDYREHARIWSHQRLFIQGNEFMLQAMEMPSATQELANSNLNDTNLSV